MPPAHPPPKPYTEPDIFPPSQDEPPKNNHFVYLIPSSVTGKQEATPGRDIARYFSAPDRGEGVEKKNHTNRWGAGGAGRGKGILPVPVLREQLLWSSTNIAVVAEEQACYILVQQPRENGLHGAASGTLFAPVPLGQPRRNAVHLYLPHTCSCCWSPGWGGGRSG